MYRSGDLLTLLSHLQLLWCYFHTSHTSGACKKEDTAPVAAADGVTLGTPGAAAGHHNSEMRDDSAPRSASSTVPKPNYAGMAGNKMVLFIWAPGARGLFLCGAGLMRSAKPSGHPPTPRSPSPSCLCLITAAALSQFIALLSALYDDCAPSLLLLLYFSHILLLLNHRKYSEFTSTGATGPGGPPPFTGMIYRPALPRPARVNI